MLFMLQVADSGQGVESSWAAFWGFMPSLVWPLLVTAFFLAFRRDIEAVMRSLSQRIQAGAEMKIGVIEVGAYRVAYGAGQPNTGRNIRNLEGFPAAEASRESDLQKIYKDHRFFFLVHSLTPSTKSGRAFDVIIYLTPHYGSQASLLEIEKVQYYLGEYWGGKIYESVHRPSGFAMATEAFGPFVVTARVFFNDGMDYTMSHYVDLRSA
jgi:hypothetical protein